MTELLQRPSDDRLSQSPEFLIRGMERYVADIASALGLGPESFSINANPVVSVHMLLNSRLSRRPGDALLLRWDERTGWSVAAGLPSGRNATVIAYLGGDLLPYPADVTAFLAGLVGGSRVGQKMPPHFGPAARDDMTYRLLSYLR